MTKYYVDISGNYVGAFDGATPPGGSIEVPTPPDHAEFFTWNGSTWVEDVNRDNTVADREISHSFEKDRVNRLLFEMNFDQENRIRVLEGKSVISKATYRTALLDLLKTL